MKAVEPEPEPVAEEAPPPEPEPEQESLLGDLGEAVNPVKSEPAPLPLKSDKHLLSDDSLYGDDDPLDKLKPQKKGLSASGSSANSAKVSGRVPAVPAKISNRGMAAVPSKISNRGLPKVETPAEPVEEAVVEEVVEEAPASSKKMAPAKASVRTSTPVSKRGIPPAKAAPKAEEPVPEELAEPVDQAPPAEAAEELEVQEEAPKTPGKRGLSSRIQKKDSRIIKGASSRRSIAKEEPAAEEEDDTRTSRRRTVREKGGKKGFTTLHKIAAGVAVLLVIVVVVGYGPFMHYWLVDKKFLAQGASVDDRKKAANEIFDFYRDTNGVALGIFSENAKSGDATIKEASIYGLEMCAKVPSTRTDVIREAADGLKAADATSKPLYIHALGVCAQAAAEEPEDAKLPEKARDDQKSKARDDMSKVAEALLPFTDIARESDLNIRTQTVDVLGKLRVIGVCQQMIKIAESSDTGLMAKARGAIASTALPDAAAEILDAMGKKDNDLQIVARQAFTSICDQARSEVVARAVNNEAPEVRKEVVKALAVRKNDAAATGGLLQAIKDKLPEIRAAAVAGFPTTGLTEKSVPNLAPLVTDSDESVRVATADTLGKLKDTESQKLVIGAFKNEMHGSTQQAFVRALGLRCPNKKTQLDESLKAIKIVMDVLEANPDSAKNVCEALALLTQADAGMARVNERRGWDVDRWRKWYANITEREKMRVDAMAKLEELRKKKDDDHATFQRLFKETEVQLDRLQKCSDMCSPNDPEDAPTINSDLQHFMILKEHFGKNAFLNER